MHTENGLLVDVAEIRQGVNNADVFAVGFRLFPERLLVDTRFDGRELPMVAIVDPVATLQERIFWLGRHRPTLGMPQNFTFFTWPHTVGYLEESGLWRDIRSRIMESHCSGADETVDAAFLDLAARERAASIAAINGSGHGTLWSASD